MSTKIKPAIRGPKNYCDYSDLKLGDAFIYQNQLWFKVENANEFEQIAFNPQTGCFEHDMCETQVLPVDVVITWTKQKE